MKLQILMFLALLGIALAFSSSDESDADWSHAEEEVEDSGMDSEDVLEDEEEEEEEDEDEDDYQRVAATRYASTAARTLPRTTTATPSAATRFSTVRTSTRDLGAITKVAPNRLALASILKNIGSYYQGKSELLTACQKTYNKIYHEDNFCRGGTPFFHAMSCMDFTGVKEKKSLLQWYWAPNGVTQRYILFKNACPTDDKMESVAEQLGEDVNDLREICKCFGYYYMQNFVWGVNVYSEMLPAALHHGHKPDGGVGIFRCKPSDMQKENFYTYFTCSHPQAPNGPAPSATPAPPSGGGSTSGSSTPATNPECDSFGTVPFYRKSCGELQGQHVATSACIAVGAVAKNNAQAFSGVLNVRGSSSACSTVSTACKCFGSNFKVSVHKDGTTDVHSETIPAYFIKNQQAKKKVVLCQRDNWKFLAYTGC